MTSGLPKNSFFGEKKGGGGGGQATAFSFTLDICVFGYVQC